MASLNAIIEFFRNEGNVIAGAPFLSFLLTAFGVLIGWTLNRRLYDERFRVQEARIADLSERLGLSPREDKYAKLTNAELKRQAEDYLRRLCEFHSRAKAAKEQEFERSWQSQPRPSPGQILDDAFREKSHASWEAGLRRQSQVHAQEQVEFTQNFRAEALVLRQELERRLPKGVDQAAGYRLIALDPGMLAGVDPVGEVIVFMRQQADRLPVRGGR